jgi:hypothetical protein
MFRTDALRGVQEFGIDIVSDDNKTIVHHKVATKVFLVMNAQDAESVSRLGTFFSFT